MTTHARADLAKSSRKRRGAFFTPRPIVDHLIEWALAGYEEVDLLDPTCGDGEFLRAANNFLTNRGVLSEASQLWGIDIHEPSLEVVRESLVDSSLPINLVAADFFSVEPAVEGGPPLVDVVVGNPPFIRFHDHTGTSRENSLRVANMAGVSLNGLASSWAAALVHSSRFLKPNGRLAMVLPAELLSVSYAAPIREWLRNRFERVNIVMFEKLQFPGAQADVILLLAEGTGSCEAFSLWPVVDAEELSRIKPYSQINVTPSVSSKWNDFLVGASAKKLTSLARSSAQFTTLGVAGSLHLGTVTGANAFFVLTEEAREAEGLKVGPDVRRLAPPLKGISGTVLNASNWGKARDEGEKVWLFAPRGEPSARAESYIAKGESMGYSMGYKCRKRKPWWKVPVANTPDAFLSYMSHRWPRIVSNALEVPQLNSLHGIIFNEEWMPFARQFPLFCLNSITLLDAELTGRWYGGGILKLELSEASKLLLPNKQVLAEAAGALAALGTPTWSDDINEVVRQVDEILLVDALSMTRVEVRSLSDAHNAQRDRRLGKAL